MNLSLQLDPAAPESVLGVGHQGRTVLLSCFKINLKYLCRTKCLSLRLIWCFGKGVRRVVVWGRVVCLQIHI